VRRALAALVALFAVGSVVALASPWTDTCVAQAQTDGDLEPRIDCGTGGPPPPGSSPPGGQNPSGNANGNANPDGNSAGPCAAGGGLRTISARRRGRGLRFGFTRAVNVGPVTVDLFQNSSGRRVFGNRRVKRFTGRTGAFSWRGSGRGGAGIYFVRFRARGAESRRLALRRSSSGRFSARPAFERKASCATLRAFKLEAPVFGGRFNRALGISYRLSVAGRTTVTVTRRGRVVRRLRRNVSDRANRTVRLRLSADRLRRGDHQVRITVRPAGGGRATTARLTAARL